MRVDLRAKSVGSKREGESDDVRGEEEKERARKGEVIPDNPRTAHGDERDMRGNAECKSCEIEDRETLLVIARSAHDRRAAECGRV